MTKVEFWFQQQGKSWSEAWYLNTTPTDFSFELGKALTLGTKRAKCLGLQSFIDYIVLSDTATNGHTTTYVYQGSTPVGIQADSAPINTALKCTKQTQNATSRGTVYMRGLPENIVGPGNKYTTRPVWQTPFNAFTAQLVSDAWGWPGRIVGSRVRAVVVGVTLSTGGNPIITLAGTPLTLPTNPKNPYVQSRVSGVLGANSVNGIFTGINTSTNTFQYNKRVPMFPYLTGGKLIQNTGGFNQFFAFGALKIGERKAGNSGDRSAGRRKVRVLA